MHLGRHLAFWTQRRGDALFMSCDGERLSWAGLDRASGALAAHLSAQGVRPGDRLGCLLGNSIPWTNRPYSSTPVITASISRPIRALR